MKNGIYQVNELVTSSDGTPIKKTVIGEFSVKDGNVSGATDTLEAIMDGKLTVKRLILAYGYSPYYSIIKIS